MFPVLSLSCVCSPQSLSLVFLCALQSVTRCLWPHPALLILYASNTAEVKLSGVLHFAFWVLYLPATAAPDTDVNFGNCIALCVEAVSCSSCTVCVCVHCGVGASQFHVAETTLKFTLRIRADVEQSVVL